MATEEATRELVPVPETWPLMSQGHRTLAMRQQIDIRLARFGMMMEVPGDQKLRVYTQIHEWADLNLDDLDANEQEIFESVDDLVDAGWRVD